MLIPARIPFKKKSWEEKAWGLSLQDSWSLCSQSSRLSPGSVLLFPSSHNMEGAHPIYCKWFEWKTVLLKHQKFQQKLRVACNALESCGNLHAWGGGVVSALLFLQKLRVFLTKAQVTVILCSFSFLPSLPFLSYYLIHCCLTPIPTSIPHLHCSTIISLSLVHFHCPWADAIFDPPCTCQPALGSYSLCSFETSTALLVTEDLALQV